MIKLLVPQNIFGKTSKHEFQLKHNNYLLVISEYCINFLKQLNMFNTNIIHFLVNTSMRSSFKVILR